MPHLVARLFFEGQVAAFGNELVDVTFEHFTRTPPYNVKLGWKVASESSRVRGEEQLRPGFPALSEKLFGDFFRIGIVHHAKPQEMKLSAVS